MSRRSAAGELSEILSPRLFGEGVLRADKRQRVLRIRVAAEQAAEVRRVETCPFALTRPLARSFYARPSLGVARGLLGRDLVRTFGDGTQLRARIVECEAYRQDDPASHSYKGRTPTRETMLARRGICTSTSPTACTSA